MKPEHRTYIRARSNLLIDVATFIAFLIATAPRLSGIGIHEWLGIAFAAAIIVHLLLHWQWIVALSKTMLRKARASSRLGYLLNLALFIDVTLLTFTGLMISEVALPLFGLRLPRGFLWRGLHSTTSNIAVLLIGLHLALHWQWVLKTTARIFGLVRPTAKPRQEVSQ
ncbi:DUF4405 domain-containing protein [Oscillochloris sp. ZM17-4]|uniref:DUF4405 domain-containing protein n=1 Tax=Oscillochloris sp. ZM17-4 TaxID=2866714 RepID=UPI001C734862|nr:DUF4405 domain-containing protein [Oscillochloris sp. ZM17-4]MBX0327024.1 DUF4405 domain-containing protein [Oscillochloris sp. ZM17-4]